MPQTTLTVLRAQKGFRAVYRPAEAMQDARFLPRAPPQSVCVSTHHLRVQGRSVCLELWAAPAEEEVFCAVPKVRDVPLLISNLQKAIRRGLGRVAGVTARELAHVDPTTLARRLIIVAIEDVRPNAHLPTAVWIMLALSCPSYEITRRDVEWLVCYATALADDAGHMPPSKNPPPSTLNLWQAACCREDHVALALLVRSAFGGMTGDMRMLVAAATEDLRAAPRLPWPRSADARLEERDVVRAAVDFHCQPSMLSALARECDATEEEVREAIWHGSSKLNVRGVVASTTPTWERISTRVEAVQEARVRRAFAQV